MVAIVKDNKCIHTGNAVETKMYLEFLFQEKFSFSPILEVCEVTLYDDPNNFIIVMDDATWRTLEQKGIEE
ncbi:hypothetical protein COK15_21185 [Bacillus cereus]|nr:hypothetical protein COK15_21185 [Bacillus cereus]